ncbi:hypothetical protein [Nostoc sp.]|uniref:hypothetical protein n=1 Tax=Nostoc sp. TaxID=1180 RepID=UPI002FF891A6
MNKWGVGSKINSHCTERHRTRFSSYTPGLHQRQAMQCKHYRILGKSVVNHATAIERVLLAFLASVEVGEARPRTFLA